MSKPRRKLLTLNKKHGYVALVVLTLAAIFQLVVIKPTYNSVKTPELPSPSLKDLARKHNIQLGNFAIANHLDHGPYTDILTREFDLALADNTPNWYFTSGGLRPTATTYNFSEMDRVVKFAEQHNMGIQAHHYLWGEEKWLPDWLKNGNYTKQQLLDLQRDHIMTVGKRYEGRIQEWTVVNEAFTRGQKVNGLTDWWGEHIGDQSYIDQAFVWARQADPSSKLILNDFGNESINGVSNQMYEYVKSAKARGIPIDGIGMQMHIDGAHPPIKDEVITNMKRFGELGVEVYVTEFDVNMADVKADGTDKDEIQGAIYYEMMRACIESEVCHSFAYLGISDEETWYNYIGIADPRPLMFDKQYRPKPAYWSTRSALEQN